MQLRHAYLCCGAIGVALMIQTASAAISLTGSAVTQDFSSMAIVATEPLPTDWKADKQTAAQSVGTFSAAVSATERLGGANLSSSAGNGIYNFGSGTAANGDADRAIGFLSSSSATKSGNLYAQFVNNGSGALESLTISYGVEKYRQGTNTAGFRVQMYYSTDGSTWVSAGSNFLTSFAADASSSGYASAPGVTSSVSAQVLTLASPVPVGGNVYLAWNYSVASGSTTSYAQALAIDDISVTPTFGAPTSWSASAPSVTFTDGTLQSVDMANGPFNKTVTLNFTDTTQIAQPTVTAPFSLLNPASDFSPTYVNGQSLVLQFRYTPTANTGAPETQNVTVTATTGSPASTVIALNGTTVKEVPLATFKSEAEAGTAGTTVYKLASVFVASNKINPASNQNNLALQDRIDGDAATRGLTVYDPSSTGKTAAPLPAVGTVLTVFGTYTNYRGLVEFVPDRPYVQTGTGNTITPVTINSTQLSDATEGVLVSIPNTDIPAGTYPKGTGFTGTDGSGSFTIYQNTSNPDAAFACGGGARTVSGIGGQFNSGGNINSGGTGYQLIVSDVTMLPVAVSGFSID